MFDALSRSWGLTKLSWSVLVADKEMLLFPLLGGIFSVLYVAALLFPTLITGMVDDPVWRELAGLPLPATAGPAIPSPAATAAEFLRNLRRSESVI